MKFHENNEHYIQMYVPIYDVPRQRISELERGILEGFQS